MAHVKDSQLLRREQSLGDSFISPFVNYIPDLNVRDFSIRALLCSGISSEFLDTPTVGHNQQLRNDSS
jgi:hypothetical protein